MYKDLSLIDLKLFLKEIIISHEVLEPYHYLESEIQRIKNGEIIFEIGVDFNEYLEDGFFKSFEMLQNKLFEEINFNKEMEDKPGFENYLIDIKYAVDFILGHFANDKNTNKLSWENMKFSEQLKDFNLNVFYLDRIEIFKRTLYDKIIDLQSRLIKIHEYKNIHFRNQKSLSGNKKIEWKKQLNQLVDFYLNQIEQGFIETDSTNVKDFLINNFTWKGKPLSESTIATYIDPNKELEKLPKEHKKINPSDFLK
jgi:hypothetical protein